MPLLKFSKDISTLMEAFIFIPSEVVFPDIVTLKALINFVLLSTEKGILNYNSPILNCGWKNEVGIAI